MKKFFFFAMLFIASALMTNAQNVTTTNITDMVKSDRCGTMQHLQWMQQQDPALQQKMEQEEKKFNNYISAHANELKNNKTSYTIPVVVHVVYKNTSTGYVSPQRVAEQITQTNSDWAGMNPHSMGPFSDSLKANTGITLCLASVDPSGNASTGIDYKQTTVTSFSTNDNVKHASTGGADAWDVTKYLNIWVCNLGSSLCAYAQFPTSGINNTYGVVVHYQFFGLTGASAPYNGGATMSHELGHCFNLFHPFGDVSCTDADGCPDTPDEYGTQSTLDSCVVDQCNPACPGIMFMNFMGYSDDAIMANLTPDQASRMQACVATYLSGLAANASNICSGGCSAFFTLEPDTTALHHYYAVSYAGGVQPMDYFWDWGDGTFDTIAYPSHTYDSAGYYTICLSVTDFTGCSTTFCDSSYLQKSGNAIIYIDVIPEGSVGITETKAQHYFIVYPNPAENSIVVEKTSDREEENVLSIYDVSGQLVFQRLLQNNKTEINVSSLAVGIYTLKIESDGNIEVLRFIKE
jgi:hypothetical protein